MSNVVSPKPYRFQPYVRGVLSEFVIVITFGLALGLLLSLMKVPLALLVPLFLVASVVSIRNIRTFKPGSFLSRSDGLAIGRTLGLCTASFVLTWMA